MKKRILIIEDESSIVELLMLVLMREGYEVKSCQSGREAVSMVKEFHPHLILLDVMLPGMDGASIVRVLSDDEQQIVDRYLEKYKITNKSRWLRETILMFIHKNMEEDYPTLFGEHDMRR